MPLSSSCENATVGEEISCSLIVFWAGAQLSPALRARVCKRTMVLHFCTLSLMCWQNQFFLCSTSSSLLNIFACAQYLCLRAQRLPLRSESLSASLKSLFARPTSLSACSGSGTRHKFNATEAIVEGKDQIKTHAMAEQRLDGGKSCGFELDSECTCGASGHEVTWVQVGATQHHFARQQSQTGCEESCSSSIQPCTHTCMQNADTHARTF